MSEAHAIYLELRTFALEIVIYGRVLRARQQHVEGPVGDIYLQRIANDADRVSVDRHERTRKLLNDRARLPVCANHPRAHAHDMLLLLPDIVPDVEYLEEVF